MKQGDNNGDFRRFQRGSTGFREFQERFYETERDVPRDFQEVFQEASFHGSLISVSGASRNSRYRKGSPKRFQSRSRVFGGAFQWEGGLKWVSGVLELPNVSGAFQEHLNRFTSVSESLTPFQ